ncbi:hypothetical protein, unlikely [Trypanosoma congolense IL3000]|uniref:Uncharacterized protein n=1 Tax=Trypanosoma congolense (strain IL3000) TaxID=1068625 RepID=F9W8L3_TRYCI|nr:hypothetical protein, unlikely [Trypanosoma congolense IL3000]
MAQRVKDCSATKIEVLVSSTPRAEGFGRTYRDRSWPSCVHEPMRRRSNTSIMRILLRNRWARQRCLFEMRRNAWYNKGPGFNSQLCGASKKQDVEERVRKADNEEPNDATRCGQETGTNA